MPGGAPVLRRWIGLAVVATAALLVASPASALTRHGAAGPLPQLWALDASAISLDAQQLQDDRAKGINAIVADATRLSSQDLARARAGAQAAGLLLIEPARLDYSSALGWPSDSGSRACTAAHRAGQICSVITDSRALALLAAQFGNADVVILRLDRPQDVSSLPELRTDSRLLALVDLSASPSFDTKSWARAIGAAAGSPAIDLGVRPTGGGRDQALAAYLGLLPGQARPDVTAPSVPTGLRVLAQGRTSVAVGWRSSVDTESGVAGYVVTHDGVPVGTVPTRFAVIRRLTCGTTVQVNVQAVDRAGNVSAPATLAVAMRPCSRTSLDRTPPTRPVLGQPVAGTSSIALSWQPSTDNVAVTGYRVYLNGMPVGTTTSTSFTFAGLSCSSGWRRGYYWLGVSAFDAAGNRSTLAGVRAQTLPCPSAGPDKQAPSKPTGLRATGSTQTTISLVWTASIDNVGVVGYSIFVNAKPAGSALETSSTVASLVCGTSYVLSVSASDLAGNSSTPASVAAQTAACSGGGSEGGAAVANLWVDPDGGGCVRQAPAGAYVDGDACGSFQAALQQAQPGDSVLVRCQGTATSCTYQPEELSGDPGGQVTIAAAPDSTVSFEEATGSGQEVYFSDLHHVTFQGIGFGHNNSSDWAPNLRIDCTRDVTLINSSGRRFNMFEGNANITFRGGDWGNYSGANEEDSSMGTTGMDGPLETCPGDTSPRPQTNILFDGVTFHDVFYSTDLSGCSGNAGGCLEWGASHPDCFEINGYVNGVTIQNSTFYHCGNTMLSLYTDQGDINNVTAQNNVFRDMAPTSYYGIQWVDTAAHTCNNDKFLNNTFMPNSPNAWNANAPPRFECVTTNAQTATLVQGNTFQTGPPPTDCATDTIAPYYTIWKNNTVLSGSSC